MICLADNDIIYKLAACNLLEETLTLFKVDRNDVYVLPAARYVLLKPFNDVARAKARIGETMYHRLQQFLDSVTVLELQPVAEELQAFDDIIGIDVGEAILFSCTTHFPSFILATHDKKSLYALHENQTPICRQVCGRLTGKVVSLEQIILGLIDQIGFSPILNKVVPARECDKTLQAIFGSGLEATEENVRSGLLPISIIFALKQANCSP